MHPVSMFEALLSLVAGGFLGWLTGGLYNQLNGRRFSGHKKSVYRPKGDKAKDTPEC